MKEKPPVKRPFLAIPEHALVFDGFPIIDRQDKQAFRANEKTARGANPFISKSPKIADQGIRMTKNVKFLVSIVMRKQQSFRNYNTKNETIKNKEPMKTIQAKKPKSVFVIQNQREKPGAKKIMAKAPEKTKKIKANERITKLTKKKEKKKPNPEISKKKKKAKKPAPRKTNPAKTRKQPASKIKIRKAKTAKKIHVSQKPKAKKKKQELEKSELKSIASKNQKPKPSRDKDKEIAKKNRKRKEKEKQAFMKRTRAKSSSRKRAG